MRNGIERMFCRLQDCGHMTTRNDRLARSFLSDLALVASGASPLRKPDDALSASHLRGSGAPFLAARASGRALPRSSRLWLASF
jgi:hypothetical protein